MILEGKTVLVTGGTGSLGKVLTKRILSGVEGKPRKVIVFSRDEGKQHAMRQLYLNRSVTTDEVIYRNFLNILEFRIGDIRSYSDVCGALQSVDIVINAAALKQVPTCEYFPQQALDTNCTGAWNIVRAIQEGRCRVETVVGVSTDKAAKPVNVMGMTKALQERIFISANIFNSSTRFVCVRYGNVIASRGSVIPLFLDQIQAGGPVTLTLPEMTRFLLTLDQGVDTIFAAIKHAKRGEIFVPRIPSATVMNIAKALIGKRKVEVKIVGIRPGEKVHETLIAEEEKSYARVHDEYYVIKPMLPELNEITVEEKEGLHLVQSSGDQPLSYEETLAFLKNHHLTPELARAKDGLLI